MSNLIECDSCKRKMFADSRTPKGEYHSIFIDQQYGYHLCRECYNAFMRNILKMRWDEDEEQWKDSDN